MPLLGSPTLSFDEIDDILYFTRVNDVEDLNQALAELAQKHNCSERDVLSAAVDPESGNTVLHFCSANGLSDLLQSLLAKLGLQEVSTGSRAGKQLESNLINATNREGNTPLHWGAYNGHLEVIKVLVLAGADVWIKNAAGHLAMFEGERAEKSDVVQYLLEAGGDGVEQAAAQGPIEEDIDEPQNDEPSPQNGSIDVP